MSAPPDVELAAALAVADQAMLPILGDHAVWGAEAGRQAAEALPWPLPARGEGYPQLLRILAATAVENVLQAIEQQQGQNLVADPADPKFQIVLRVVKRAVDVADAALQEQFGGKRGAHRLSGKREFFNRVKEREVDAAVKSAVPRAEALESLGFSRAAAYRAMKRKRR